MRAKSCYDCKTGGARLPRREEASQVLWSSSSSCFLSLGRSAESLGGPCSSFSAPPAPFLLDLFSLFTVRLPLGVSATPTTFTFMCRSQSFWKKDFFQISIYVLFLLHIYSTGCLQTADIYLLTVLEAGSLQPGSAGPRSLQRLQGRVPSCLLQLVVVLGVPGLIAT